MPRGTETPDESTETEVRNERTVFNDYASTLIRQLTVNESYEDIGRLLLHHTGRHYSADSIGTRFRRGTFTLAWFVEFLQAKGIDKLELDLSKIPKDESKAK